MGVDTVVVSPVSMGVDTVEPALGSEGARAAPPVSMGVGAVLPAMGREEAEVAPSIWMEVGAVWSALRSVVPALGKVEEDDAAAPPICCRGNG